MKPGLPTYAAAFTASLAWAALALQFGLIALRLAADGHGFAFAAWRFAGYFTILTNIAVATVSTALALRPGSVLAAPRARLTAAASITLVGLAYSLLLRNVWSPTGWQAVADHTLHDVTPILFLIAWGLADHGRLSWRDAGFAALFPMGYFVYAMARGSLDGWYAYWFLDPANLAAPAMALNAGLLTGAFLLLALGLVWLDGWFGSRFGQAD